MSSPSQATHAMSSRKRVDRPSGWRRVRLATRLKHLGEGTSLASLVVAALGLLGWVVGWRPLAAWVPQGAALDPDTAVGLAVAATLQLALRVGRPIRNVWWVHLGSIVPLTIGVGGFAETFLGTFGLEVWPFAAQAQSFGTTDSGSFTAAACLVLAVLGLWMRLLGHRLGPFCENFASMMMVLCGLWGLIGYVFHPIGPSLTTLRAPMSLPAATASLGLALGMLLVRPDRGLTALVAREGQGGRLARRLLPLALLTPAIITAVLWVGVWTNRYPAEFVACLLAAACGVVFFGVIWWYAETLDQAEARSRKSDEALRSSEAFFHSLVESLPQSILRKDKSGRFIFGNTKVLDALGITLDQFVGKTDFDFYPAELAEKYRRDDLHVLETGETLDTIEAHRDRGGDNTYVQVLKTPLRDHGGKIAGVQCIFWDVTERKIAEEKLQSQNLLLTEMAHSEKAAHDARKQAQSQMIQSAKLAGLGELVAGVAHEINNPLSFVNNNVAVLERDLGELRELVRLYSQADDLIGHGRPELARQLHEFRDEIDLNYTLENLDGLLARTREGLRRIQQIVKDLRVFARLDESELGEFDLNENVRTTVTIILGHAKRKRVAIDLELAVIPPITGFVAKINQVVMNLISNAIDACHEGGKVLVRTAPDVGDMAVRLDVIDDGVGIPPEVISRIFDPFFTTKPVGVGTGLGLSISYGIVQDQGGTIEVESNPGQGARFTVRLPQHCRPRARTALESPSPEVTNPEVAVSSTR